MTCLAFRFGGGSALCSEFNPLWHVIEVGQQKANEVRPSQHIFRGRVLNLMDLVPEKSDLVHEFGQAIGQNSVGSDVFDPVEERSFWVFGIGQLEQSFECGPVSHRRAEISLIQPVLFSLDECSVNALWDVIDFKNRIWLWVCGHYRDLALAYHLRYKICVFWQWIREIINHKNYAAVAGSTDCRYVARLLSEVVRLNNVEAGISNGAVLMRAVMGKQAHVV